MPRREGHAPLTIRSLLGLRAAGVAFGCAGAFRIGLQSGMLLAAGERIFIVSPSLLSRCGVRSPVQTQGRPLLSVAGGRSDGRAVLERASGHQAADGGRVHGVAPGDVSLCLALCKAMQRLITLMRSPWRNISDGRRALDAP